MRFRPIVADPEVSVTEFSHIEPHTHSHRFGLLILTLCLLALPLTPLMAKNTDKDNHGKPDKDDEEEDTLIEIYDDGSNGSGGECTAVGDWNATSKTCTLTRDVDASIQITDPNNTQTGVTLDGDGHRVNLPVSGSVKVLGYHHNLKDLNILGAIVADEPTGIGVSLYDAYYVTVSDVDVANTRTGVALEYTMNSVISDSTFSGVYFGVYLYGLYYEYSCVEAEVPYLHYCGASSNVLENNSFTSFSGSGYGIYLAQAARENIIRGNTVSAFDYGIYLPDWSCGYTLTDYDYCQTGNIVYQNNLIDNHVDDNPSAKTQIYADWGKTTTIFNLDAPDGGNYYSDFDVPEEGCVDANEDGFCDSPYYGHYATDYLPWTSMDGWLP